MDSTSNIVSRLGGGSGVDMVQLARDLSELRYAPRVERLTAREEALEARISAAATVRSQLSELASALGDRIRGGDLAPAASVSDPAIARASVAPGGAAGSYQLEVLALAEAQTLAGPAYADGAALVGEGTLTLRFGTVDGASFAEDAAREAVSIAVGPQDTLADVARAISASGAGVTAFVAQGTGGAQLVLKGQEGAANGFVVEADGPSASGSNIFGNPNPSAPGNINHLAWRPADDAGQLRVSASDALIALDTVEIASPSNSVTGLPGGLSLDLTGTTDALARVTVEPPTGAVGSVMTDLAAALNDIAKTMNELAAPRGGVLGGDPGARALKRALAALPGAVVMPNAPEGTPRTLGDLGLGIARDGSFTLDRERLDATLAAQPQAAAAMFTTGLFGVFATVEDLARATASAADPGSLAGSVARYERQDARIEEQLARIAEQQERLRERLVKQYTASDRNVAASQSTLSFLEGQIALWNRSDG